ncbi:MAG: hypothetical protein ABIG93_02015 [archaeon]
MVARKSTAPTSSLDDLDTESNYYFEKGSIEGTDKAELAARLREAGFDLFSDGNSYMGQMGPKLEISGQGLRLDLRQGQYVKKPHWSRYELESSEGISVSIKVNGDLDTRSERINAVKVVLDDLYES